MGVVTAFLIGSLYQGQMREFKFAINVYDSGMTVNDSAK